MTFCKSYTFVLLISSMLFIPLSLAIRTLLAKKVYTIVPILRLRITTNHNRSLADESSNLGRELLSSI